jgi:hypothetical protein
MNYSHNPYNPETDNEFYKEFMELLDRENDRSVNTLKVKKTDVCVCDSLDLFRVGCKCNYK